MQLRLAALIFGLALASCATVPPPAAEAQVDRRAREDAAARRASGQPVGPTRQRGTVRGEAAEALSRQVLAGLGDGIAEVRRVTNGPGWFLSGLELWEAPKASGYPGLCAVNVHRVGIEGFSQEARYQPEAQLGPGVRANSVITERRFRAVGSPVGRDNEPPMAHAPACARLTSDEAFFVGLTDGDAHSALQAFDAAQRWARNPQAKGAGIECVGLDQQPCADGPDILGNRLRPENITAIKRVPCERETPCWEFSLADYGGEGLWTVTIRRLSRPMQIRMQTFHPPVS